MQRRRLATLVLAGVGSLATAACGSTVPLTAVAGAGGGSSQPATGADALGAAGPSGPVTTAAAAGALPDGAATVAQGGAPAAGSGPGAARSVAPAARSAGHAVASPAGIPAGPATTIAASAIPTQGPGWDAQHVYIGVPTENDVNTLASQYKVNFNGGDVDGDVKAVVDAINQRGGLFGRQVVPEFHDNSTASLQANPETDAEATCTDFTQDHPVAVVINGIPALDTDSFRTCLQQRHLPLLSLYNADYGNAEFATFGPYLFATAVPSTDVLVPTWLRRLAADQYFTGWNTLTGAPGTDPVKVGIMEPDDANGHHVADLMTAVLGQLHVTVASSFFYSPTASGSQAQNEVLQFKAAQVTHVLNLPPIEADQALFMVDAEQEQYRPRYGLTSFSLPLTVQQNPEEVSPNQLAGSIGVGWQPFNDVDSAHNPGAAPGQAGCLSALQRGGETFTSSQERAELLALQICDAVDLFAAAAPAGGGLSGPAIAAGIRAAAPTFPVAGLIGSSLSGTSPGLVATARDFQWVTSCSCFQYFGTDHPFGS